MEYKTIDGDSQKDIAAINELSLKLAQTIADSEHSARVKIQSLINALAFAIGNDAHYRSEWPMCVHIAMREVMRLVGMYIKRYEQ